jgi:hypothetical protein
MSEPRKGKSASSPPGSDDPTLTQGPAISGRADTGSGTQYPSPTQPTPSPGEQPWGGPVVSQPPVPWGGQESAPTRLMGSAGQTPSFAWLVMIESSGNNPLIGKALPLKTEGAITIGRVPGNDIIVPDRACSSQHARVRMELDAQSRPVFVIHDLASSNGLFVGSKDNYKEDASRVYRHILADGDYVLIGETTFVFKQV